MALLISYRDHPTGVFHLRNTYNVENSPIWPNQMRCFALFVSCMALCIFGCEAPTHTEMTLLPFDQLPVQESLPDPLLFADGDPVSTESQWHQQRVNEIRTLFSHYMYGYMPPAEAIQATIDDVDAHYLDGMAIKKQVTIRFGPEGTPPLHLLLVIPSAQSSPSPVFLGTNFYGNHSILADSTIPLSTQWVPERGAGVEDNKATEASRGTSIERWSIEQVIHAGYAVATFYHADADPDKDDFTDGLHASIPVHGSVARSDTSWGSLSAWAYAIQRSVDYLLQDPDIDARRIAVMGHSRNGKAALWAGATDPRIALVISNQSGCGGAALSRRKMGETVEAINTRFPHWFSRSFWAFNNNEDRLPLDQHMLISLMAPRPVLVASAEEDDWADPEGEFLSLQAAEPVYKLLGYSGLNNESMPPVNQLIGAELGYHIRPGGHGVGPRDWDVFIQFANTQFAIATESNSKSYVLKQIPPLTPYYSWIKDLCCW